MKLSTFARSGALALIIVMPVSFLRAQTVGDPNAGGDVFESYCSDCHSVSARGTNKKGPSLYHVVGRRAGIVPGFAYSPQMRSSGIIWTQDRLAVYLANPKAVVPNGIMKFKGLQRPQDRANIVAFLRSPG